MIVGAHTVSAKEYTHTEDILRLNMIYCNEGKGMLQNSVAETAGQARCMTMDLVGKRVYPLTDSDTS